MNYYCQECGTPVDMQTGRCPRCGKYLPSHVSPYNTQPTFSYRCDTCGMPIDPRTRNCPKCANTKKRKKKTNKLPVVITLTVTGILLVVGVVLLLLMFLGGSDIEKTLDSDRKVFESGDINKINSLILQQPEILDEIMQFLPETNSEGEGLVADLVALSEIEIKNYNEDTVTVIVTAPDMSGCSETIINAGLSDDENALQKAINEYAEQAEKIITEVTLDYVEKDGEIQINYNTEDFLNAVTGNFSVAYSDVYNQYLKELVGEVEVND